MSIGQWLKSASKGFIGHKKSYLLDQSRVCNLAHISSHNELKTPYLGHQTNSCKEKAAEKISFFEKLAKAKEQGTTNKGNNPLIGLANLMGRFSRSSVNSNIDEKMALSLENQLKRQNQSLSDLLPLDLQDMVNEEDFVSTPADLSENLREDYLFDSDSEEALSRLCNLSQYSASSKGGANRLLQDDKIDIDSSGPSAELFSLSQTLKLSYRSREKINQAIQTEVQNENEPIEAFDTFYASKNEKLLQFFWGSIKFALLPVRIFISIMRFLWNFDENMTSIKDFFIHSGNMIKQSDLFLTSINDSQLVFVAADLMQDLEEMAKNLRELSFDKNLSQIVENTAKITEEFAEGEKIKAIIENLIVILDSINDLLSHFKPDAKSSFSSESYYEKVSGILTSLNIILDDMVFMGPFKGLMGAWDKYRKDRLESYEKLNNKQQFEEAVAKEVRDLEIVFKRYHALLDKARIKGFHHETVTGFNGHLSRLTTKTHHMQSEKK